MGIRQETQQLYNLGVGGSGVRVRRYPVGAVGITLTSDGAGAYTYPVAAWANIGEFVAHNVIKANWRYFGIEPFVPGVAGREYFIILGSNPHGAAAFTLANALLEVVVSAVTVIVGSLRPHIFPYAPTVVRDDINDGAVAGMTTGNAAAETLTIAAMIATGFGT